MNTTAAAREVWRADVSPTIPNHLESRMALPMKDYAASFTFIEFIRTHSTHRMDGSATVISKYLAWYLVSV